MIEFYEDTHTYVMDGERLPSVTQLLSDYLDDEYADIPPSVLDKAAKFGTTVHKAIELYEETGILRADLDEKQTKCLEDYINIKDCEVIESERIVHYKDHYAGTLDCVANTDKGLTLIDYKTSSKAYPEKWAYQLSLYKKAYEWMTGQEIKALQVYHLKKIGKSKIIELSPIPDEELRRVIHEF